MFKWHNQLLRKNTALITNFLKKQRNKIIVIQASSTTVANGYKKVNFKK